MKNMRRDIVLVLIVLLFITGGTIALSNINSVEAAKQAKAAVITC